MSTKETPAAGAAGEGARAPKFYRVTLSRSARFHGTTLPPHSDLPRVDESALAELEAQDAVFEKVEISDGEAV